MNKSKIKILHIISVIVSVLGLIYMMFYGMSNNHEELSSVTFHSIAGITFIGIVITSHTEKYLKKIDND